MSGLKSYIASTHLAKDSLSKLPENIREAHKSGMIHIHDLDGSLFAPYCVHGGTHILTKNGTKFARNVKIDDILIGYNEMSGVFEETKVTKLFERKIIKDLYELVVQKDGRKSTTKIHITGNHKVLTSRGWLPVEELNIGEEILYKITPRPKDMSYMTEDFKGVVSETVKNQWKKTGYKEKILEQRLESGQYKKVSQWMKEHNPMKNPDICKKVLSKTRKTLAKKGLISKPQTNLYNIFKEIFNDTELDYPVTTNNNITRYIDVAIPSLKLAIEYDGLYWHNLPGRKESDEIREMELKELGWNIAHLTNKDKINENVVWNIISDNIPLNGAKVVSKTLIPENKQNPFKVYNFHCFPHENYIANGLIVHNCYGADLQQLLMEGLKNPVGSSSTPAKHMDTAIDHIVNYIYISQSEFNGAQAFSNCDTLLAPFAIGRSYKYIKQNLQRLIYNISYPLRSSFQTPFFNMSFDIIPPIHMKNEPVVVGGKTDENLTYGDMQKEMDMINSAFLELMIGGDSKGKPFTFPIPTYGITKDLLAKDDDVTRLLYTLAAKFGSPNFQNYIKSGNDPSDVRSMCCRLSLDIKKLKSRGLWNMGNKTGSLGVVTINLNHCSKDGESHFIENIDKAYDMSVEELKIKHKYIMESFDKGLLPFTRQYLDNKDPFKTFFHTIGIAGMNEACLNMFETTIENNQDFTEKILKHVRTRVDETTEETNILHNLEETPIEGATYRLAKLDKKLGLPTQGKEEPYLTNSTHCPVNTGLDWIQNVRIQEKFKPFYSGGTILHGFVGEEMSPKSAEHLIKQMACETKIPYYNITPTFSNCKNHGHQAGNVPICPVCNEENLVYSRVVGYLQPVQKYNLGKKEEFKDRKMYKM